jgi:PKD repeat protein
VQYTANVHGGASACQLINTTSSNNRLTTKAISVVGGQAYTIKFWVRGHGDCRAGLWDGQGTGGDNYLYDDQVIKLNSDTWTQQTFLVEAPATADNAEFIILVRNTNADKDHLQFDDVEITGGGTVPLSANFKADITVAGIGATIKFADLSTGNVISWEWTVTGPEIMTSTIQNPSFTFTKTGSYDVKLIASDDEDSAAETKADYITIGNFILLQDFNSGNFGNWETISIIGDQKWTIRTDGGPDKSPCAEMNGYSGGNKENEDWLVSPAISASSFVLTFDNAKNFTGDDLKLMVSENYSGNVATATWNQLNYTTSTGNYNWANSGEIKYAPQGGKVHIAFKYISTTSDGALWRVDNIVVRDGNQNIVENPKAEINIFPNPTRGELIVMSSEYRVESIEMFDMMGKKHEGTKARKHEGKILLDISHLASGVYFIQIQTEMGVVTKKVVKN